MRNNSFHIVFVNVGGTRFSINSEDWLAKVLNHVALKGYEITVIEWKHTAHEKVRENLSQIKVMRVGLFGLNYQDIQGSLTLRRIFEPIWSLVGCIYCVRLNPDSILTMSDFVCLWLSILFPHLRKRTIMYSGGFYSPNFGTFLTRLRMVLDIHIGRQIKLTVAENHIQSLWLTKNGFPEGKLRLLEPAIDVGFWAPSNTFSSILPRKHEKVVLFHGRVVRRKGIHDMIEAAYILINGYKRSDIQFFIVGPPAEGTIPTQDELSYISRLQDMILEYKLTRNVHILLGWWDVVTVKKFYDICDIYVLPTLLDMAPHSIKQALAMGKPVVSTKVGWISDLVINGVNGYLVDPGTPQELAQSLATLLDDDKLRMKICQNNRLIAIRRWNINEFLTRWEDILSLRQL